MLEADEKLFDRYPQATLERFKKFHSENPLIYVEFERLADQMIKTGRKKYSARTIVEVMRWHRDIKTTGDVFEINGDFVSIYVRLLIYRRPEFLNFFELRQKAPNRGKKSEEQLIRESLLQPMEVNVNGTPIWYELGSKAADDYLKSRQPGEPLRTRGGPP